MLSSIRGQANIFAKTLFLVASAIALFFVILNFIQFQTSTIKERESSNFKNQVLNVLQKLLTDQNCLAYVENKTFYKITIDKKKLDEFTNKFIDLEPECSKALDFDYNIKVVQFEHIFSTYPGELIVPGKPQYVNSLAWHDIHYNSTHVWYGLCNFEPQKEPDKCIGELDGPTNCPQSCWYHPEPWNKCPGSICCINYICPKTKCQTKINQEGGHPYIVICNVSLKDDCEVYLYNLHRWCGKVAIEIPLPVGPSKNITVQQKIWEFGLAAGITSFSPEKARKEELQISLPITIRYNETFSTEGIIYIYAVRGELESLVSILEDVCEKASFAPYQKITFTKDFHFSYPINFYISPKLTNVCMLSSCKKFVCNYSLYAENISIEGDYLLKFSFDPSKTEIAVRK